MNIRKFSIKTIQKGMKSEFYNFFFTINNKLSLLRLKVFIAYKQRLLVLLVWFLQKCSIHIYLIITHATTTL